MFNVIKGLNENQKNINDMQIDINMDERDRLLKEFESLKKDNGDKEFVLKSLDN
jgi:hypothetical protein